MNTQLVDRYLYRSGSEIWQEPNGLLSNFSSIPQPNLIGLNDVVKLPGGILLAEGGMGKTTFMEQLEDLHGQPVHLFKLYEYIGDPGGFSIDFEANLTASSGDEAQTLILDGLDEAPDLAGVILRMLRKLSKNTSVWISSRDGAAIRTIQESDTELNSYNLAPLTIEDLHVLATQAGVNGDEFLDAVDSQGLLPICAKPLGCELALSVFRENGLTGVAQRDLWHKGIERLCDETPAGTRQLVSPQFPLNEVLHCSAWISLCLTLTDNRFVWNREPSYCPEQSLGISDLASDRFSADLIQATLQRGVFSTLGDGCIMFSHAMYGDFLAAFGFKSFIPVKHWTSLFLNGQRDAVFPQREGIAVYLATYDKKFLEVLSEIQPELLLESVDSVQAIGPDILCNALLERADNLSYKQRQLSNLHRLKADQTIEILKNYLLDPNASTSVIELATAVAKACEYSELAEIFADRVLNLNLSLSERIDSAYAVCRLKDENAKRRLKRLLPIDPAVDPEDDLLGTVLRACWPVHLTPEELIDHLVTPQKSNYMGAYSYFLQYDLPASLESSLDKDNAIVLLTWALNYIERYAPFDTFGRLARTIYTVCWKWSKIPEITQLLAKGYAKAFDRHRSPFLQLRYEGERISISILTKDAVLEDVEGRFAVLEALLTFSTYDLRISGILSSAFPLYTQEDLPLLFDRAISDPSGTLVEKWVDCIIIFLRTDIDEYTDQIDQLHELRPDLIDDSKTFYANIEKATQRFEEQEQEWKKEEEEIIKEEEEIINEWTEKQSKIDNEIKKALHNPNLTSESFERISSLLNSENGRSTIGPIDIRLSPGWDKLTEDEQSIMLDLAQHYLTEGKIYPTEPDQHSYSVARALTALRLLRPDIYSDLSQDVWERCSVELLKSVMSDNVELLAPLLDRLSKQFPDIATDAVLDVLSQEPKGNVISIIHNWGTRLNDEQAAGILDMAGDPAIDHERRFIIVNSLARQGKEELVLEYLNTLFDEGWSVPSDPKFHKLRKLAFVLSPASHMQQLLDALESDPGWGQKWIETSIGGYDGDLLKAILSCESCDLGKIYIWLHEQYPKKTRPEHEGVYTPAAIDEIHRLKNEIINHLSQSGIAGSSIVLDSIMQRFPADTWLTNCILDARRAEQATTLPILPVKNIKKLSNQKTDSRCLLYSVQDLLDLVMNELESYRAYLQGDNPAVGDLWNSLDPNRPHDEEYLSDHLKRYLDLRLTTDVVINREVQIRRKLFNDGMPGSRTDLWIQAFDEHGSALTICIEVKCNWNNSANTALKEQLIDKYMSGQTAKAGIFLLGWFGCDSWDCNDNRRTAATAIWPDMDSAIANLQKQAEKEQNNGSEVRSIVIDCTLRSGA